MNNWSINEVDGVAVGFVYTYNYEDGSTSTSFYDAQWNWIGSSWTNADGSGSSYSRQIVVDSQGNTSGYIDSGRSFDSSGEDIQTWENQYDADWNFQGGTSIYNSITTVYDSNWNVVSQTTDVSGLTPIIENGQTVGYQETDDWGTTTYYDLDGNKTGSSYTYAYSDGWGYSYTSTTTYDAAGNWISSTSEGADGYGYQWSDRSETLTDAQGLIIGYRYQGSWSDGSGNSGSYDYSYDANWNFQGYTSTYNGTTTVYDSNWNVVSQTTDVSGLTPIIENGQTVGYQETDDWGTTTYYDLDGNKTGSTYTSYYEDGYGYRSTYTSTYDAAGNWISSTSEGADGYGYQWSDRSETLTDAQGQILGYRYQGSWSDGSGNSGSYDYSYDANWNFQGYTSTYNGTTTVYDSNWNVVSQTTDVSGLTPIIENGQTVGYQETDDWGTTTYYDLDGNKTGSSYTYAYSDGWGYSYTSTTTYDAAGNWISDTWEDSSGYRSSNSRETLTDEQGQTIGYIDHSTWSDGSGNSGGSEYRYDANWNFQGYTSTYNGTTTVYDSNWNVVSQTTDVSGLTPIIENGQTVGYQETDDWGTTTYYDLDGNKTGSTYTSYYEDGYGYRSTYTSTYDAAGNWISSTSEGADGYGYQWSDRSETLTDAQGQILGYRYQGSWSDGSGNSGSYDYSYDANWNFQGYTSTYNGTTTVYDSNWNVVSQTTDVSGLTPIIENGQTVGYQETDDWGTTTYYDLDGNKTGSSYTYAYSDGWGYSYTSTTTYDAAGNWISDTWEDSSGYRSSNSRETLTDEQGQTIGYIDHSTWSDGSGNSGGSEYRYDANWNFQGYTSTYNGTTTVYDSNWNVVSQTTDVSGLTPIIENGQTVGYQETDDWGTTTYYDLDGNKTGSSYTYAYSDGWGYSYTSTTTYDAAGNWISDTWEDSSGYRSSNSRETLTDEQGQTIGYIDHSTWSDGSGNSGGSEYRYDANWNFQGYTSTYNGTTTVYDSNWNVVSQTTDVSGLTPIIENGQTVGYQETDDWGTTTYYDLDGNKTGSSYTYAYSDGWGYSYTSTTTYDAAGNWISDTWEDSSGYRSSNSRETLTDEQGQTIGYIDHSTWSDDSGNSGGSEYRYDANWNFQGYTSTYNGTTTVYDSNWNVVSQTTDVSGLTPIIENGQTVGYQETDDWGTTTYYDLDGNKTGSSYTSYYEDGQGYWKTSTTNYDAAGNLISETWESSNGSGDQWNGSRETLTNDQGQIIGYIAHYNWSNDDGDWNTSISTHDAAWNLISETWESGNGSGDQGNGSRETLTNDQGQIIGYIQSNNWSNDDGDWSISISTHDAAWNLISQTSEGGNDSGEQWNNSRETLTNDQGQIIGYIEHYNWSNDDGDWNTSISTHDAAWNLISQTSEGGNDSGEQWNNSRETLTNDQGQIIGYIEHYNWSNDDGDWNTSISTHDAAWNLISQTSEGGDSSGEQWNNSHETLTNDQGQIIGYIEHSSWSNDNGDWDTTTATYDVSNNLINETSEGEDSRGWWSGSREALTDNQSQIIGYIERSSWSDNSGNSGGSEYNYDANWNFQGGSYTYNGTTTFYDSNWAVVDGAGMGLIVESDETLNYQHMDELNTSTDDQPFTATDDTSFDLNEFQINDDASYELDFSQDPTEKTDYIEPDTDATDETQDGIDIQLIGLTNESLSNDLTVA
jgi:hypothetical protein